MLLNTATATAAHIDDGECGSRDGGKNEKTKAPLNRTILLLLYCYYYYYYYLEYHYGIINTQNKPQVCFVLFFF